MANKHSTSKKPAASKRTSAPAVKTSKSAAARRQEFAIEPAPAKQLLITDVALRDGQAIEGRLEFSLGQLQGLHMGGLQTVKTRGVLEHRGITARLHRDIARSAKLPDIATHFANDGSTVVASTPANYKSALDAERKKWGAVIQRANIKAN